MIHENFPLYGISTFTHLGRHIYSISRLIKYLESPEKIVCLGSGFIEPFLFAEQLGFWIPNLSTAIEAVDREFIFIDSIRKLLSGGKIKVSDFAKLCCDSSGNGEIVINTNVRIRVKNARGGRIC